MYIANADFHMHFKRENTDFSQTREDNYNDFTFERSCYA